MLRDLTAVDWSSEASLVVAGVRPDYERVAITEVSIDGAAQTTRLPDLGSDPVTYLAAVPGQPGPRRRRPPGAIAYVLDDAAYDVLKPDRIEVGDLAGPVANPPKDVRARAPRSS